MAGMMELASGHMGRDPGESIANGPLELPRNIYIFFWHELTTGAFRFTAHSPLNLEWATFPLYFQAVDTSLSAPLSIILVKFLKNTRIFLTTKKKERKEKLLLGPLAVIQSADQSADRDTRILRAPAI